MAMAHVGSWSCQRDHRFTQVTGGEETVVSSGSVRSFQYWRVALVLGCVALYSLVSWCAVLLYGYVICGVTVTPLNCNKGERNSGQ